MNMMYLIIWLNSAMVVIPEVYPEAQCESIVKDYNKTFYRNAICIPAPRIDITKDMSRELFGECKMVDIMKLDCPLTREDKR